MVRSGLDMAAYVVLEAANLDQAIAHLEQHVVNLVLTALELPPRGGSALLAAMRLRAEWDKIPSRGFGWVGGAGAGLRCTGRGL